MLLLLLNGGQPYDYPAELAVHARELVLLRVMDTAAYQATVRAEYRAIASDTSETRIAVSHDLA